MRIIPDEKDVFRIAIFGDLKPVRQQLGVAQLLIRETEKLARATMYAVDAKRKATEAEVKATEASSKAKLKAVEEVAKTTKLKIMSYLNMALQSINMVVSTATGIMEVMGVQLDAQFQCMLDVLVAGLSTATSVYLMYIATGPYSPLFYLGLAGLAVSTALQIQGAIVVMQSRQFAQMLNASAIFAMVAAGDRIGAAMMYADMM